MVLMLSTSLNLNLSTSICFSDILKTYRCARHADKSQPSASVLEVKKKNYIFVYTALDLHIIHDCLDCLCYLTSTISA